MTDQEAEIVKFTLDQQDPKPQITLVLRGRDDGENREHHRRHAAPVDQSLWVAVA